MSEAQERTALYRIRGEDDELIYIGITTPGIPFRWNQHQAIQPWWDEVRSVTVEWYDKRSQAAEAEEDAIVAEQPKYNVTYLKPGRGRRGRRSERTHIDWESAPFEPWDDDDELIDADGVAKIIRMHRASALTALRNYDGPRGFTLGPQRLFRRGEIRRWVDAVEASQRDVEQSADDAGTAA